MDSICSVHHTMAKSIQALSDAAQMCSAKHLKGCKIYSLPIFLFLFCFIKGLILLSRCQAFLIEIWREPWTVSHLLSKHFPLPAPVQKILVKWEVWVIALCSKWELSERQSNGWRKLIKIIFAFLIFHLSLVLLNK